MSRTEHHIGALRRVGPNEDETYEDAEVRLSLALEDYDQIDSGYISHNGSIYQIESKELDGDDDIIQSNRNDDGTISFQLRFYNGGTWFGECLRKALDKL